MTSFDLDLGPSGEGNGRGHRLDPSIVERFSRQRDEPAWMTEIRLRSLRLFDRKPMAAWLAVNMAHIDFRGLDDSEPAEGQQAAERQSVAGVTAQRESEAANRRRREELEERGILFCDMDTALRDHPHLVEQYLGTAVSPDSDSTAALNTAVWSGGSFVYVPPGVEVDGPLQIDLRADSQPAGRFERTLIIADTGSKVHTIAGCSAPVYTKHDLHATVVEIVVRQDARVTHTAIQNWSPNVHNHATKRARVGAGGGMMWIDGNIGAKLTMTTPAVHLVGDGACGEVLSVACAGAGQHQHIAAEVVHAAPNTTSKIVSKSISTDGGTTTSRGLVRVHEGATGVRSHVECDALVLDDDSTATTSPHIEIGEPDAQVGHEATVSTISDEQRFYLMSRGLSDEEAIGLIVDGFIEPVTKMLPMEYAVEWSRLIELQILGSVG